MYKIYIYPILGGSKHRIAVYEYDDSGQGHEVAHDDAPTKHIAVNLANSVARHWDDAKVVEIKDETAIYE